MNDMQTLDLLKSTGCLIEAVDGDDTAEGDWVPGEMEPLANPMAVSALAGRLSNILPSPAPDIIAAWPGLPNVALAFAVGVQTDTPVIVLSDAEGLVTASGSIETSEKVALVGVRLSERDATLARAFVESKGGTLAVAASLVGMGEVTGELSLVSLKVGVDGND